MILKQNRVVIFSNIVEIKMKTNCQNISKINRALCLIMMCLFTLSGLAQIRVDESQLIGTWYVEDSIPNANEPGFTFSNGKIKGNFTYQAKRMLVWKIDFNMDMAIDIPAYKNQLKIGYSLIFYGKWSIKKGNVLIQKMTRSTITPINIIPEHENPDADKTYIPILKSRFEEVFLKEANRMTEAGEERILSINEKEMVTEENVYRKVK